MLSKISQIDTDKYSMISLICGTLKKNQTHRNREQICGCQRQQVEVEELGEGGQKVQMSSHKINRSWGCNVQPGDYS